MTEPAGCPCCRATTMEPVFQSLSRCPQCGYVVARMDLTAAQIEELYASGYYQGEEYLDYEQEAPALEKNFRARLGELTRAVPEGSRMLELGCAYGYFLNLAKAHYQVEGCDISAHAAEFARSRFSLDVWDGDYLLRPAPGQPYRLVCMWDTIEHLQDPFAYVKKVHAELAPGGCLALSTGDIGSLMARFRGRKWRLLHPPSHLHYFTKPSMTAMLERNGFEVVRIFHAPFWRSMNAVAYRLLAWPQGNRLAGLYRVLKHWGLLDFCFPINTFDLMTVYAKKK